MDSLKKVNLITATIEKNQTLKIEIIYELENEFDNFKIYFEDKNNKKYEGNCIKANNTTKVLFCVPIQFNIYTLKIEENSIDYNTIFLDNKGEKIINSPNQYQIFTNDYIIAINPNGKIVIKKRKIGDKFKYEISKLIYSKKMNGKICLLRLLKHKEKYYLFNDRILYGDDNAEQLFIHINKKHKKIAKKCYFVIDKNSNRIHDLKKIGRVLKYGSIKHKIKYLNAKMVISSHASYYDRVYNPFNEKEMEFYKDIICKRFVFVQHGVIMNDVHSLLQRSHTIADLIVTTTNEEYNNVNTPEYMYEEKMIVCTGLPRFDKLLDNRKKVILISPTWRAYLTNVEYTDDKNNSFLTSEYYTTYASLLQNKELLNSIKEKGYVIKFLLHPAFQEYKDYFFSLSNDNVKIIFTQDIKYSDLFNECSLFITDYSSIHFDVAFLEKPIIYYQFDREKFFESHYTKGYYDYERDGFGQVIENEKELIEKIEYYLKNSCEIEMKYKKKIEETFRYLNRENSERVYKEILKLEEKPEKVYRFNNIS